ncbi:MAG TPA: glycosyltransferase family 1 protein [Chloroflexia bacterium]|nr:glycosyltransferase family 1 protein [Chloroflexia bacterium]
MLIGYEASALQGRKSGVGYYTENMLASVMRAAPQHRYMLFSNRDMREGWKQLASETVHSERLFPVRAVWMQAVLPGTLRRVLPDLCHFTNYLAPLAMSCPYIVTVYDMTVFITPRLHRFKKLVLDRTLIPRVARKAGAIITVSNSARKDILRYLKVPKEKVRVVMGAASPAFHPITDPALLEAVRARHGLHEPYILYVGTIEPRKNLPRLVQAFASLKKRGLPHKLVIVGQSGWQTEPIYAEIEQLGLKPDVLFTGYVPFEDLPAIYTMAEAMAFPSLYEGFGLPVIEAMACGTPVVTSRSSSLIEVAGDAGMLVDPLSVEEIEDALHRVLNDPALRADMRYRGLERASNLTWEHTAQATLEVYDKVLASKGALAMASSGRRVASSE